jgi:hypothetical protein
MNIEDDIDGENVEEKLIRIRDTISSLVYEAEIVLEANDFNKISNNTEILELTNLKLQVARFLFGENFYANFNKRELFFKYYRKLYKSCSLLLFNYTTGLYNSLYDASIIDSHSNDILAIINSLVDSKYGDGNLCKYENISVIPNLLDIIITDRYRYGLYIPNWIRHNKHGGQ